MVTCYPPGSRYTKHVDNGGVASNGRRLTTLIYMNEGWSPGDGGELAVYVKGGKKRVRDVEPTAGRLVLFWSDDRVPHEVLTSMRDRYTVTIWFFDGEEWEEAKRKGIIPKPTNVGEEEEAEGALKFVKEDDHEAREPDGSDLKDVVVTNEPFVEVGETPTLNNLNRGEVEVAKADVEVPEAPSAEAPTPPPPPQIPFALESTDSTHTVTFTFSDLATLTSSELDVSPTSVIVTAAGGINCEVEVGEEFDGDNVKAKIEKKRLQLIVTVQRSR